MIMKKTVSTCTIRFSPLLAFYSFFFTFVSIVFSLTAHAQHSMFVVELHPQASVLYEDAHLPKSDYVLALGKYKKRNNRWRPNESLAVKGSLSRYTVELPKNYSVEDVFAFYTQQLPSTTKTLFRCLERACGESNNWANDHFQIKQLYGLDETQYYGVFEFTHMGVQHYATIYSVRRGNRRLYVQLDIIAVSK